MLLDALKTKVSMVKDINYSFRDARMELDIISFYTEPYPLQTSTTSSRESLELPNNMLAVIIGIKNEDYLPLGVNHLDMGRISGVSDTNFRLLVHYLWRVITAKVRVHSSNDPILTFATSSRIESCE